MASAAASRGKASSEDGPAGGAAGPKLRPAPFALERLSVTRGPDGRATKVRYVLPSHKAAQSRPKTFPRSTFTASDPSRAPGHDTTARTPDFERLLANARKRQLRKGKPCGLGKAWCGPGDRSTLLHEPLISSVIVADVPLAGLPSCIPGSFMIFCHRRGKGGGNVTNIQTGVVVCCSVS